jgi:RNA polymerase sigma-70 factor (ECF subfamily)
MPDAAFDDENAISVLDGRFCVQSPQLSGRIAGRIAFRRQTPPCVVCTVAICLSDFLTNLFMRRVYLTSDPEDLDLVRQAQGGQKDAFGALVNRYQKVMYNVALRMLGNPADAQDATQDAFVKAYERLASFDSHYRFYSWMYRILVNECLNVNRGRRPEEALDGDEEEGSGTPFDVALDAERREQIQMALLRLTPDYRTVVVLRHFAGQSYDEIAEALAIPEKTVKSRLYSARQRLGELLLGWKQSTKAEDR